MNPQSIAAFLFITLPWLNPFSPGPAPAVMPWLVTLVCLALLVLSAARIRLADVAAKAWLAAALLSAVLGVLQYFGATAVFGPWVNSTVMGDAFANLRQRNQFATLTNMGLAALLWQVAQFPLHEPRRVVAGAAVLVAAVLLAVGNAASSSRTGLVQLLMLIAMAWYWSRGGDDWRQSVVRRALVAAALAYGIAAMALPGLAGLDPSATGILARLHDGGSGCSSRLILWRNVLHLIAQKPWLGWGWGELDYAHFITLYPGPRFCEILDNAHNLPLHLAVERGVPVALVVCAAGVWAVWRAKPWRALDATRQLAWTVLAIIMLHSMLEYPLWYGPFQMAFGLCLWLLCGCAHRSSRAGEVPRVVPGVLSALSALLFIAMATYAAWDYHRISQIYLGPAMRSAAYRDNTLQKAGDSWLFQNQVRFAELTITPVTIDNAARLQAMALALLHFSPEPRVLEKLIESAVLLGRDDEALFYRVRYQAAFPESHARWVESKAQR